MGISAMPTKLGDHSERSENSPAQRKILAVCTLDVMVWKLLRPWFHALLQAGYEVHIACARTNWFEQLAADGFQMHNVPLRRRMNPLLHIAPLFMLHRLIRRERFALVNTHSPVAAAVGRVAAWFAREPVLAAMYNHCLGGQTAWWKRWGLIALEPLRRKDGLIFRIPVVLYTVHGFYFHDNMTQWKRRAFIALEWLLGQITDSFMFVSDEDRQTALREGIAPDGPLTMTIYNGVDLTAYPPKTGASPDSILPDARELRNSLNIPRSAPVVGIVGRVVREKGYIEFAEMAKLVSRNRSDVYFLVVGDALPSDRDGVAAELRSCIEAAGLQDRFRFTGLTDRVVDYLHVMDIFVLPSYREGFPSSVLEAMSCALPVVATKIRGCREAVVDGETGLLIPPRSGAALAEAVTRLLQNPELAIGMGAAGRERAVRLYDQRLAQQRFAKAVENALRLLRLQQS